MALNNQEYVVSPHTNKPIKVNSRAYKQLVNDGEICEQVPVFLPQKPNKKVMYKIQPETTIEELGKIKEEMDSELEHDDYQVVKGRGFYKDKLVTRSKPPTTQKVVRTTKSMINKTKNNQIEDESRLTRLEKRIMKLLETDSDEDSDSDN